MQSSSNTGIITYRETKMPSMLSMLTPPKLEGILNIKADNQEIGIFLFDCPVNGEKLDRKRYKLLRELVDSNKIKFIVERFEAKTQSNVTPKKNELHYSQLLKEIKAIKQLAVLLKLSQDRNQNLLAGNVGFIMNEIDSCKLDYLSEEATNVMLYSGSGMNEKQKNKLHNDFMEKKGVSIIFSKDISSIISSSSVISIDEGVDLRAHAEMLKDRIVLGKNKCKEIKNIDNIILWTEELKGYKCNEIPWQYNDEILVTIRYFNYKLDIIDFIKRFPYIYFD